MSALTVSPSTAATALLYAIRAKQPTFVWGAPGIGKSDVIRQVAASLDLELIDIRAILLDPVDLRGLPHINSDGLAHWAEPGFLPRSGNGVLFLDELNRAPTLVQNAGFQLVLDRKLGDYVLPPGWVVLAAGNRESDGGGITRMPSALANRFLHLEIEPTITDWSRWAIDPDRGNIDPLLIAFLRWRPELLHEFDRNARAFPSPRSWAFASRIMRERPPKDLLLPLLAGTVGEGAAVEVLSYYDLFQTLPSVDAILLSPTTAPVPGPNKTGELYALASALAHRAEADNLERICQYLGRLPQEYDMFCMRDIAVRAPALQSSTAFITWAINHQGVI